MTKFLEKTTNENTTEEQKQIISNAEPYVKTLFETILTGGKVELGAKPMLIIEKINSANLFDMNIRKFSIVITLMINTGERYIGVCLSTELRMRQAEAGRIKGFVIYDDNTIDICDFLADNECIYLRKAIRDLSVSIYDKDKEMFSIEVAEDAIQKYNQ